MKRIESELRKLANTLDERSKIKYPEYKEDFISGFRSGSRIEAQIISQTLDRLLANYGGDEDESN